ncbi:type II toxin-antitoxin system RelE/ParE family toxin [Mobiluncus sp.]|uniref:type II toxin-antitoxin system RelE/ParE family toxin n=1 Tax=Mobiluncus sp. TaxID=47293 RepID=UPI002A90C99C|nr:type II toxin-antitoxin system RelE/ParE family toxin [Mobiluncus sp.]MDY6076974.1 type II toxin-antitoxin system RelE/ParE family toxin [Mobiluncus sp.]
MKPYRLKPAAQKDLSDIWDYTQANWGVEQAEKYTRDIQRAIETLADNPLRGPERPDIAADYRSIPAGKHAIFFRVEPGGIVIVRILHESMDPGRHL